MTEPESSFRLNELPPLTSRIRSILDEPGKFFTPSELMRRLGWDLSDADRRAQMHKALHWVLGRDGFVRRQMQGKPLYGRDWVDIDGDKVTKIHRVQWERVAHENGTFTYRKRSQ